MRTWPNACASRRPAAFGAVVLACLLLWAVAPAQADGDLENENSHGAHHHAADHGEHQGVAAASAENQAGSELTEELMARGLEVYNQTCVLCHQGNGMGLSGAFPPLVAGAPFEASPDITRPLEERGFYADGKILLGSVEQNIEVVVNGIPGTRMFAFGPVLSDEQIAAVITYHRNAWGNDSGDVVTADQVAPFRRQ